jgi:hypothetical protein
MSLKYTARNPIIINYTLTNANTWYKVASAVAGVRKWMIKVNESTSNPFDIDFTTTHTTIFSNSGIGFSLDNCDLPDTYCRSSVAGTIIEILYFG